MAKQDFRINTSVRRLVSRAGFVMNELEWSVVGGHVLFQGRIVTRDRISGTYDTPSAERMERFDRDVKRIENVRGVQYRLTNLRRTHAGWEVIREAELGAGRDSLPLERPRHEIDLPEEDDGEDENPGG